MAYKELENDIYPLKSTTLTNPASGDINTAMLDAYSAVIITTTTTWSVLTLWTPTNTSAIKRFSVINKSTSTHSVTVNEMPIAPWVTKFFIWDLTAWTIDVWNIVWQEVVYWSANAFFSPSLIGNAATSGATQTANSMRMTLCRSSQEHTYTSMALWYTVGVASNSIGLWIYLANERGLPTTLLWESGLLAATAWGGGTVTYTFPTPITIPINTNFYIASAVNQFWTTVRAYSAIANTNPFWNTTAASIQPTLQLAYALTPWWTGFPNPAPAAWSYTYNVNAQMCVFLQEQIV